MTFWANMCFVCIFTIVANPTLDDWRVSSCHYWPCIFTCTLLSNSPVTLFFRSKTPGKYNVDLYISAIVRQQQKNVWFRFPDLCYFFVLTFNSLLRGKECTTIYNIKQCACLIINVMKYHLSYFKDEIKF
jgi:hypothetical protein